MEPPGGPVREKPTDARRRSGRAGAFGSRFGQRAHIAAQWPQTGASQVRAFEFIFPPGLRAGELAGKLAAKLAGELEGGP